MSKPGDIEETPTGEETEASLFPFTTSVSTIFMQGREYTADSDGIVWLPYKKIKGMTPAESVSSTKKGQRK